MRVLLIEDDQMIGEVVEAGLADAAYAVDWVREVRAASIALAAESYDLVLLDLGLPHRDGLDVLADMRRNNNAAPVVILTARDAVEDRIRGLDGGADDYLPKPFAMSELLARMRAVLRRRGAANADPLLRSATLTLDPSTRLAGVDGAAPDIRLSRREYALLEALMIRPGAILSRSQLEARIYGWGEEVESNAVEFILHGLRKKLGKDYIRNVRGLGWMVSKSG